MTRPTKEQRALAEIAAQDTIKLKASLGELAARATLLGWSPKAVRAIRSAFDLWTLLQWSPAEMHEGRDYIEEQVDNDERKRTAAISAFIGDEVPSGAAKAAKD